QRTDLFQQGAAGSSHRAFPRVALLPRFPRAGQQGKLEFFRLCEGFRYRTSRRTNLSQAMSTVRSERICTVVIGSSAGGIAALLQLLGGFSSAFRLTVIVVQHLPDRNDSLL